MFRDTLRSMNLYVNGKGYAGAIDELTLPKLTLKTEEYRAGGMDMPIEIDMGMEKLETSFTLAKFDKDLLASYGLTDGNRSMLPLTIRGSIFSEEDGSEVPVVITLRGMVKEMDFGNWKAGENATVKATVSLRYYKFERDGEEIHEIDIANMVRKVNGVDQLEQTRKNIGL